MTDLCRHAWTEAYRASIAEAAALGEETYEVNDFCTRCGATVRYGSPFPRDSLAGASERLAKAAPVLVLYAGRKL